VSWSPRFAEPIVLADGAKLAILRENVSEYFSGSLVFLPKGAAVGHDLHGNADLRSPRESLEIIVADSAFRAFRGNRICQHFWSVTGQSLLLVPDEHFGGNQEP
jgi:hypothetical protein